MIRAALLWLLTGAAAFGQTPDQTPGQGLIENRTGLPLTLPLQVKMPQDRDAYIVLSDAETDETAVTAYAGAGRFFRLLVPPGTYVFRAALGTGWQGPEDLFGEATRIYRHPDPLTFRVRGLARKEGHLIDLSGIDDADGVEASALALCQSFGPMARAPARQGTVRPGDAPGTPRSVAPEIPFGYPLPPGPRDPGLDGRPDLGMAFGNRVDDVPLWLRLGEGEDDAPATARPSPPAPAPARPDLRQRLCS